MHSIQNNNAQRKIYSQIILFVNFNIKVYCLLEEIWLVSNAVIYKSLGKQSILFRKFKL